MEQTARKPVLRAACAVLLAILLAAGTAAALPSDAFASGTTGTTTAKYVKKKVLKVTSLKVKNVSSSTKAITMKKGNWRTITAQVSTKKATVKYRNTAANKKRAARTSALVTFKSSNPKVVTVKKTAKRTAKLTAKSAGTAYITITAKGWNTKTYKLKVTVKKTTPSPTPKPVPDNSKLTRAFAVQSTSALLGENEANSCYSPLSAYLALSMVAQGADGQTQSQLVGALGATSAAELAANSRLIIDTITEDHSTSASSGNSTVGGVISSEGGSNATVQIANSIWSGTDFDFTTDFVNAIKASFDGTSEKVDFGDPATSDKISKWVSDNTRGLLNPSFSFDSDTIAALVNTVYFKDNWMEQFSAENNAARPFTNADKTQTKVPFMQDCRSGAFYKGSTYSAASLGLTSGGEMTFYLPAEGVDANSLIATPEATSALLNTKFDTNGVVDWKLPKFSFDAKYELADMLKGLGAEDAFDEDIRDDFASMLTAVNPDEIRDPYIDSVQQGTHIGLNEEGVEAAAYTAVIMKATGSAVNPPHLDFDLNRPFIYTITAKDGSLLFVGIVQDMRAE